MAMLILDQRLLEDCCCCCEGCGGCVFEEELLDEEDEEEVDMEESVEELWRGSEEASLKNKDTRYEMKESINF